MTVGIAATAMAGNERRIVLMCDKQFSGSLKIEEQTPKVMVLMGGWLLAFSGIRTFAREVGGRANTKLAEAYREAAGKAVGGTVIADRVHTALLEQWTYAINRDVLIPLFLNTATYRQQDPKTRAEAEAAILSYMHDNTCELLLCGFGPDDQGVLEPNIYTITIDGHVEEIDFAVIGSAAPVAEASLTWRGTKSSDPVARVSYDVYEAKAHAELDTFVGKKTDAWIMNGNADVPSNIKVITDPTKSLLDQVFRFHDQSPYQAREKRAPRPPRDWEAQLAAKLRGVMPAAQPPEAPPGPPTAQPKDSA